MRQAFNHTGHLASFTVDYDDASRSKDDFKTWKLKKYIDDRILYYIIPVTVGVAVLIYLTNR